MCLLTFMHEGVTPNIAQLTNGAENNPDGFGFALHDRTSIISFSSLNYEEVLDKFLVARAKCSGPGLFHSRITTHGGTSVENCHPFRLGNDPLTVMGHNGMLPIEAKNGRSDTRILAEDLLPQWGGAPILNSKKQRKKLGKFADGSKLVFLSANPDVQNDWYIINERDGHWDNGVWWSNNSYKWARHYSSGMYTSGWSRVPQETERYSGNYVTDLTFVDSQGEEVWMELWTCVTCGETAYVDDENVDYMLNCAKCDCCWYCSEDKLACVCVEPMRESWDWDTDFDQQPSLSIPNYDSAIDHF